jgi:uncharacterized protein YndB with AHSA1/START domain
MPYIFKRSIIIHASPEQVYDELLDIEAHKEWGDMSELELLFEGPVQVGSRWRSAGASNDTDMHDECTITILERPRLFGFQSRSRSEMGTMVINMSYHVERVSEGTRVTFSREFGEMDLQLPIGYRILLAIPGSQRLIDQLMIAKIADRGLAGLRDRVEQTGTSENPISAEPAQSASPTA